MKPVPGSAVAMLSKAERSLVQSPDFEVHPPAASIAFDHIEMKLRLFAMGVL